MAGFEPAVSCARGTRIAKLSHTLICKAPSGSRTHTSAMARQMGYHYIMGAKCITTKLSKINNQEHRAGIEPASPRYDGGVLPLDHQCLFHVSVGPVRIELTSFGLRDRCITLSATIPNVRCRCFVSVGVEGIEPSTRRLIRTPLSPLSYTP